MAQNLIQRFTNLNYNLLNSLVKHLIQLWLIFINGRVSNQTSCSRGTQRLFTSIFWSIKFGVLQWERDTIIVRIGNRWSIMFCFSSSILTPIPSFPFSYFLSYRKKNPHSFTMDDPLFWVAFWIFQNNLYSPHFSLFLLNLSFDKCFGGLPDRTCFSFLLFNI